MATRGGGGLGRGGEAGAGEKVLGKADGGDLEVAAPPGMVMPVATMPLGMPMSASGCFSQPKVLQEKLLASLGAKFKILQL